MSQEYLGEFEQMVMLTIMRLGDRAYGLAVRAELESVAGRRPSSGALYTTLDRLEKKYSDANKTEVFDALLPALALDGESLDTQVICELLGIKAGNLRVFMHRFRARFGSIFRSEVTQTIENPEVLDQELEDLISSFSKRPRL